MLCRHYGERPPPPPRTRRGATLPFRNPDLRSLEDQIAQTAHIPKTIPLDIHARPKWMAGKPRERKEFGHALMRGLFQARTAESDADPSKLRPGWFAGPGRSRSSSPTRRAQTISPVRSSVLCVRPLKTKVQTRIVDHPHRWNGGLPNHVPRVRPASATCKQTDHDLLPSRPASAHPMSERSSQTIQTELDPILLPVRGKRSKRRKKSRVAKTAEEQLEQAAEEEMKRIYQVSGLGDYQRGFDSSGRPVLAARHVTQEKHPSVLVEALRVMGGDDARSHGAKGIVQEGALYAHENQTGLTMSDRLNAAAIQHMKEGDFVSAVEVCENALRVLDQGRVSAHESPTALCRCRTQALRNMGYACRKLGRTKDAIHYLQKGLATSVGLRTPIVSDLHLQLCAAFSHCGKHHAALGSAKEAEDLVRRQLEVLHENENPKRELKLQRQLAIALHNTALENRVLKNFEPAMAALVEALSIAQDHFQEDPLFDDLCKQAKVLISSTGAADIRTPRSARTRVSDSAGADGEDLGASMVPQVLKAGVREDGFDLRQEQAAVKIQSVGRMRRDRERVDRLRVHRREQQAAVKIQSVGRMRRDRERVDRLRRELRENKAAVKIQSVGRMRRDRLRVDHLRGRSRR